MKVPRDGFMISKGSVRGGAGRRGGEGLGQASQREEEEEEAGGEGRPPKGENDDGMEEGGRGR